MTRKYICPSCSENTGVDIVYGEPSVELAEQAELREIALGGCSVEPNQPNYRCMSCGFEWDRTRQFEEAKQRWLKETVKGRSWTEMMDDKHVPGVDAMELSACVISTSSSWAKLSTR